MHDSILPFFMCSVYYSKPQECLWRQADSRSSERRLIPCSLQTCARREKPSWVAVYALVCIVLYCRAFHIRYEAERRAERRFRSCNASHHAAPYIVISLSARHCAKPSSSARRFRTEENIVSNKSSSREHCKHKLTRHMDFFVSFIWLLFVATMANLATSPQATLLLYCFFSVFRRFLHRHELCF